MARWNTEQMKAAETAYRDLVAPRIKVEEVSQTISGSGIHRIAFHARHVNQAKGQVFAIRVDGGKAIQDRVNPTQAAIEAANATIEWMTKEYGTI